jgi:hypothetical protein
MRNKHPYRVRIIAICVADLRPSEGGRGPQVDFPAVPLATDPTDIMPIFRSQQVISDCYNASWDAMVRFLGNCLLAFPPKPHASAKSRKCHVRQGFRARDVFRGRPLVSSHWPEPEPFGVGWAVDECCRGPSSQGRSE